MTMEDVDHTHPHTDEPFNASFRRGPAVAADGGRPDAAEEAIETMEDVTHDPPSEGANRSFERGTEGRTDTV
ncbi:MULTISPECIES: hypothetical protein [Salinibaculum]|uniref:hypothetical protein n=1 Tax=Salinibaculum TaxID=2732368 RepID=UPI0030D57D31